MATHPGTATGGPTVTSHPLFPLLLALWFAALLGLGSLAVRPAMLEQIVLDLGIDTVIGAAAPPLGTTFRALLAASLGAFGAVVGALIASRLRTPSSAARIDSGEPRRARDAHPDAPPRRPISAREEFGDEDIADAAAQDTVATLSTGRRRPLAIQDDSNPPEFFDYAPLPGATTDDEAAGSDLSARLGALVDTHGTTDVGFEEPVEQPAPLPSEPEPAAPPVANGSLFMAAAEAGIHAPSSRASAADRLLGRPLDQLSTAELSERLAIAIERRQHAPAALPGAVAQYRTTRLDTDDYVSAPEPTLTVAEADLDADALADGYSSLLDLSRPPAMRSDAAAAGPALARLGAVALAPPLAPEPAPAPHARLDSDRANDALKTALATLQRMSGAA